MGYIWMFIIRFNYNYPWYVNVHVALIYTCNMKENALASCISYARVHCVESGVGAWYCLFTGVGEWVVSSENGTKSMVETHKGVKPFKWQVMCVGRIWVLVTRCTIGKVL